MISRRELFELAGVAGVATALPVACEGDMARFPLAPWHMWGTDISLRPVSGGAVLAPPQATGQLVRINYARPDTWDFLLAAQLDSEEGLGGAPIAPGSITVLLDVVAGLGRTNVSLQGFGRFVFQWLAGQFPLGATKWSTRVRSPVLDDQAAVQPDSVLIEQLVAQDIQVSARVQLNTPVNGDAARVTVSAFFAPRVHVRPEWFAEQFRGNEQGGS